MIQIQKFNSYKNKFNKLNKVIKKYKIIPFK